VPGLCDQEAERQARNADNRAMDAAPPEPDRKRLDARVRIEVPMRPGALPARIASRHHCAAVRRGHGGAGHARRRRRGSMKIGWMRCAALALGLLAANAGATKLSDAVADLSPAAQTKVADAARAFVRAKPAQGRSANDLGWDCQAAIALADLGVEGATGRLAGIAEALDAGRARSARSGKAIGWPQSGAQKTCLPASRGAKVPAACEGASTIYSFQSGLGIACLARAGSLLGRPEWTATARDAMAYWDRHRIARSPCEGCIYFATSDSAEDEDRYIRNMNLFVAFGASELGQATQDARLLEAARHSVRADIWERNTGNRGYLGKLDPLWTSRAGEAERIENHSASMAILLKVIGNTLADPAIARQARTVWRDWATCDNHRCKTAGCPYWAGDAAQCQSTATAAHCAFRMADRLARAQCETLIALQPSLGSYGLWAVTLGAH
jgi:hypothetical protein